MSKFTTKTRRIATTALATSFIIGLSSCGANDSVGLLDGDGVYAEAGKHKVTYRELWDELKWNSKDVLDSQITNVVISKQTNNINTVMTVENFSNLTDEQKEDLNVTTADEYNALQKKYLERLFDYVIDDIYNFAFEIDDYEENIDLLIETEAVKLRKSEQVYINDIYSNYHIDKIDGVALKDIVTIVDNSNPYTQFKQDIENGNALNNKYIKIGNTIKEKYYVDYGKELFARDAFNDEIKEAEEADDDDEDDYIGYFSKSELTSSFQEKYTQTYDVDSIIIKFQSDDEYQNTLRAFGLRIYNSKYYFIADEKANMTYDEYVKYYNNYSVSKLEEQTAINENAMVEIYVQLYNYIYGGYRTKLDTKQMPATIDVNGTAKKISDLQLNELRVLTDKVIENYSSDGSNKVSAAIEELRTNYTKDTNDDTKVNYTSEEIQDLGGVLKSAIYKMGEADNTSANGRSKSFSTSSSTLTDGTYIACKLHKELSTSIDENVEKWYTDEEGNTKASYEIVDYLLDENNTKIFDNVVNKIIDNKLSESKINEYVDDAKDDIELSIYNEACEIAYSAEHSTYSKALSSADNENIFATIKYNDVKFNLNIVADKDDEASVMIPGTTTPFGVFDYLERSAGTSTAIKILTDKYIKDTKAYENTDKNRDVYERVIENMLAYFTNGGYESNGYKAAIGKYNFMMLYFHSADIDEIIDNNYRTNAAQIDLLTDFANDNLIDFFKTYSDNIFNKYFSMNAKRVTVIFNKNDDINPDMVSDWHNNIVDSSMTNVIEFQGKSLEYIAKQMLFDIYEELSASTSSHNEYIDTLVDEIKNSAKTEYEFNPIASENKWAKYRHLGLSVTTEDIVSTNSGIDNDMQLKQRLFNYAMGEGKINTYASNDVLDSTATEADIVSSSDVSYQYFIHSSIPTCYIEPLTKDEAVNDKNDVLVETKDGYNLLLVTSGSAKASAEFLADDNEDKTIENIYIKYNNKFEKFDNIYSTDADKDADDNYKLNKNQIKYYLLDYVVNGEATVAPTALEDAYTSYLQPVINRFTNDISQSFVYLYFIKNSGNIETDNVYDIITFKKDDYTGAKYNGENGVFSNIIKFNEIALDEYNYLYNDKTNSTNLYDLTAQDLAGATWIDSIPADGLTWWDAIEIIVKKALIK